MPRAGRPGGGSLYGQGGSGARRADVLYEENDEQRRSVIALVRGCWRGGPWTGHRYLWTQACQWPNVPIRDGGQGWGRA